ncbi:M3 family metallopeptidase [Sphingosinicella xenopeptidilytica]|uniref:M3 family metallopeptidase n=1 Tax=Sphingosinicella xenopeptidilytica TaxID=364098 RepID=A0ABW3C627_SPHXN
MLRSCLLAGAAALAVTLALPASAETPPAAAVSDAAVNALLAEWTGPNGGVPPWDKVQTPLFKPAFDKASAQLLAEVDAIANNPAKPTFANTLEALEKSGEALNRLATLFFVMSWSKNDPAHQAISAELLPQFSAVEDKVNFNAKLFKRVKAVYDTRETSGLNAEQKRLVEKSYENFVRSGASQPAEKQAELGKLNQQLATLFNDFGNKVQADEDTWVTLGESDLGGLPPALIAGYKAAATERKLSGYAVVNTRSAVDPFLTFSSNRALREKVWRAFIMRGDNANTNNTHEDIRKIVKLRADRAKLLGYASHAHWRMSDTMAKDPQKGLDLLMRVWPAARARVAEEVADMQKLANSEGAKLTIEPWDYRYYMEKVRKARYDLDQNEFKNYFELENMIAASYHMAGKLYGYSFKEITGTLPTFHPDVRVYHVTNTADGTHVGYLYRDDFARQYKRSGAWQSTYRGQDKLGGRQRDAIVSNNNNFTKGAPGDPVLISLDDARTLFHEFGHALHALSNDTTYPSLGGTPRDFVEFPSQVHENWVLTPEILDTYARHYKTGAKMPQALIDKLKAAETFNQGFETVEFLGSAIVDMKIHMDPSGVIDPAQAEKTMLGEIGMPREIVMRHRLPQFGHLFSSDAYSAGYYSYLWSDVMAADAWAAFEEAGDPWDAATAKRFKDIILATGDAIDRAEAYRAFRGRDPQVEALLRNRGFPTD